MKHRQILRRGLSVLLSLLMCLTLLPATALAEGMVLGVAINESTFPDATFRGYVSTNFDKDSNGILSPEECAAATEIDCSSKGIKTLNGIGYFKELTTLDCSGNQLTSLNVSNNEKLTHLNCSGNQLTSLDLSYTNVTALNADNNSYAITLTGGTFDLSKLPGNFDVSKASNWKNGTANGNILTVNSGATEVTYDYNCGKEYKVGFTLKVVEGYTITFSANGGSGSMDAETVVSGSYTLPTCTFTAPAGKQFKGWATSATGEVIADTTITVTGNTTLYAIWENIPATTCNETADFTSDSTIARALELLGGADKAEWSGTTLTLTLKGVDFTTTSPTAVKLPGGSTIVLVGDNIITTSEQPRTLSYGIYVTGDLTIEGSGTLTAMGAENADLSFGIYAEKGVVKIKSGTVIAAGRKATRSSIGIYASKEVAISGGTVTATGGEAGFDSYGIRANGFKIAISGGHVTAQTLSTTGEKSALNVAPDLSAYTGYKWRISSDDSFTTDPAYTYSDTHTYVEFSSQSTVTTYTVSFDANGGVLNEGSKTSIKTEDDGTVDYLAAATREGYTFDGWYTAADGGEKVYTYVNVFTADTTVYAHWTPEAETKQITEASFALKGYTVGANAKDIVVTSHTEGLSLAGGYFEALGKPYSYLIAVVDGNDYSPVNGQLEAGEEYVLMLKAGVDAGYDVGSGLTKDAVILNGTIAAEECGETKQESSIGCTFDLPVLTAGDTSPAKNTVTVNGSHASATGAGEYEEGDIVTLAAGSRSGYTFSGWTSNDVIIPNAGSADTSFVMPAKAVTVTANWTYTAKPDDDPFIPQNTQKAQNGWVEENGVWYYYSDDAVETGWQEIDDVWYYFDPEDGAMAEDGMQEIGGEIYYFRDWGGMASNAWYQDDEGSWYYFGGSGAMVRNQWVLSKGIWYYLGSDGVMLANQWLYWNDAWYYLSESGAMLANQWLYWNDAWYYLSESGAMLADQWLYWNGTWYYLGSDGAMLTDTVTSDGYYVNKDGVWVA